MNPADLARGQNQDPGVTPAQGRVVFHQERLFRSTGNARPGAYPEYIKACQDEGLPARICEWTPEQCRVALHLMEIVCHKHRMDCFRDCRTGWEAL